MSNEQQLQWLKVQLIPTRHASVTAISILASFFGSQ